MGKKGGHIDILGDYLRRFYQHLMVEARDFREALRKTFPPSEGCEDEQPRPRG
jgi:hypothetical protein